MLVAHDEVSSGQAALVLTAPRHTRGSASMYLERVLQAHQGGFDFLVGRSERPEDEPDAIFEGWIGRLRTNAPASAPS